ncbi:hypothetical protein NLM33_18880 [Bradyrhizobium sp. CCGUVB1N3]|uniref:hypothetical protein n=1 Tax=Bradyrhizobium sp. CCGUVB1N3 TaxID=2949629 RepID=UPI0020B1F719|nr:hypothetical protein [Bradyrhizobium sp. CCGUVB1N3]MCP3471443.1 hypothetical protein [Bradyrhizobium sp. CCGUVB1N3]MCP3472383.1 hypothetical protein [Bradyrhizobium sp. CCGUVB1N3]
MTEHTKDKLAGALREVGLHEMAERAATGFYHDFLSPLDLPEMELEKDLRVAAQVALSFNDQKRAQAIEAVRKRHINGDFDASPEESEAWAESEEGRDAFRQLIEPRSKK